MFLFQMVGTGVVFTGLILDAIDSKMARHKHVHHEHPPKKHDH